MKTLSSAQAGTAEIIAKQEAATSEPATRRVSGVFFLMFFMAKILSSIPVMRKQLIVGAAERAASISSSVSV